MTGPVSLAHQPAPRRTFIKETHIRDKGVLCGTRMSDGKDLPGVLPSNNITYAFSAFSTLTNVGF